jgi:beta-glucosidase
MAPNSWQGLYDNTLKQVKDGVIPMSRLDEAVARILRVKVRMGLFEKGLPSKRKNAGQYAVLGSPEHRAVAREAARKSMVLLKNNNNVLPLKATSRVLIAGDGADNIGKQSGGWTLTWQGTGNKNEHFPNGESLYHGLHKAVTAAGGTVTLSEDGVFTEKPDVAIVVFGEDPYAEFIGDRPHLDFTDDTALMLLTKFKQAGIATVSVFLSGRPLWVNPELNQSDAFVAAFLPGSEGGALADLIVQKTDGGAAFEFTGKLSFSWPNDATGKELNIGSHDYKPLFPYGYGLKYGDKKPVAALTESSGLNANEVFNDVRYVMAGKAATPWQIHLVDNGKTTVVENATQVSTNRAITTRAADRKQQEDTVIVDFHNKGIVAINHAQGNHINWVRHSNGDMAIELDYQVLSASGSPVRMGVACGKDCGSYMDITDAVKAQAGKGWRTSQILLRCFNDEKRINGSFRLDHITSPFVLVSEGAMTVQIARVRLMPNEGLAGCELK